jgi:hypothetical protein
MVKGEAEMTEGRGGMNRGGGGIDRGRRWNGGGAGITVRGTNNRRMVGVTSFRLSPERRRERWNKQGGDGMAEGEEDSAKRVKKEDSKRIQ